MRKYIITGLAFFLFTGPGSVDAWLSLIDRFFGEGKEPVVISVEGWYQSVFPLFGLAILLFGIWWTRDKKPREMSAPVPSSTFSNASPPLVEAHEEEPNTLPVSPANIGTQPGPPTILEASASDSNASPPLVETHEEEPNTLPVPPANKGMQPGPSTILQASASDLIDIIKGKTTVELNQSIPLYIGNLIQITGDVFDIQEPNEKGQCVVLHEEPAHIMVFAYFSKKWMEEIQKLYMGQEITVLGSIASISRLYIDLTSCFLAKRL